MAREWASFLKRRPGGDTQHVKETKDKNGSPVWFQNFEKANWGSRRIVENAWGVMTCMMWHAWRLGANMHG